MSYYYDVYQAKDDEFHHIANTQRPHEVVNETDTFMTIGEDGLDVMEIINPHVVAILSSALAFAGGVYKSEEVEFPKDLTGIPSYCGHPNTRALLTALGAEYVPGRREGPQVGESFLAVPLARNERADGYTKDVAVESVRELDAILVTRIA